jgi:hypothetical protein
MGDSCEPPIPKGSGFISSAVTPKRWQPQKAKNFHVAVFTLLHVVAEKGKKSWALVRLGSVTLKMYRGPGIAVFFQTTAEVPFNGQEGL